jgi:branched-chain amino acid transport system permease protein
MLYAKAGSMRGAFVGALIVGLLKAGAIAIWPEVEMLAVYVVVVAVLVLRPTGLFARAAA